MPLIHFAAARPTIIRLASERPFPVPRGPANRALRAAPTICRRQTHHATLDLRPAEDAFLAANRHKPVPSQAEHIDGTRERLCCVQHHPFLDLYGAIGVKAFRYGLSPCSAGQRRLLVPTCFLLRLLRGAAVKGGRRPSRSDLPLTAASTAADLRDRVGQLRRYRGELAIVRADRAPRTCIRPTREGRNHDAVMRIGGEAPRGRAHSKPRYKDHSPTSGCRHLGSSAATRHRYGARLQQLSCPYAAGRSSRPTAVSPVVTSRHSAMRSLRASATIIVLRVPPRASEVRFRYHAVSALAF